MQKYGYISVNNILGKFHRDFRGLDISETDAIEWAGEALGMMKFAPAQEEAVAFLEVKNHQATLPNGIHYIIQVARHNEWESDEPTCPSEVADAVEETTITSSEEHPYVLVDCNGALITDHELAYYRPYFDLKWEYELWCNSNYYKEKYTPVRLANHTLFHSLVCQDPDAADLYSSTSNNLYDEYTVIENKILRFSFETGFVAVAYLRQKTDDDGYPMIPDSSYATNAVTYFLTWKIKQREGYLHRQGAMDLADRAEAQWEKYRIKFKGDVFMPKGIDQHQNIQEQGRYLIPRFNRYYGFFGKMGRSEHRVWNNNHRFNVFVGN